MKIAGTFDGEVDPADPRNAVIVDINLAPTTAGKVRYSSTFFILRPVDLAKGNGKLFYDFGNRGSKRILEWFNDGTASNDPSTAEHYGNGFLMRQGYIVALSGYAGDVAPGANVMSVTIPVVHNPDRIDNHWPRRRGIGCRLGKLHYRQSTVCDQQYRLRERRSHRAGTRHRCEGSGYGMELRQ